MFCTCCLWELPGVNYHGGIFFFLGCSARALHRSFSIGAILVQVWILHVTCFRTRKALDLAVAKIARSCAVGSAFLTGTDCGVLRWGLDCTCAWFYRLFGHCDFFFMRSYKQRAPHMFARSSKRASFFQWCSVLTYIEPRWPRTFHMVVLIYLHVPTLLCPAVPTPSKHPRDFRRIFVFTNDDDPLKGNDDEKKKVQIVAKVRFILYPSPPPLPSPYDRYFCTQRFFPPDKNFRQEFSILRRDFWSRFDEQLEAKPRFFL